MTDYLEKELTNSSDLYRKKIIFIKCNLC